MKVILVERLVNGVVAAGGLMIKVLKTLNGLVVSPCRLFVCFIDWLGGRLRQLYV